MADTIPTVAQGISASFVATVRNAAGDAYTGYAGTESLAGTVRTGRDAEPLIVLAPVWLDHTAGTITVPFPAADTADVEPGRYLLELHLDDDSADLFEGFVEITFSAGTAAALASYATFGDMLDVAPAVEKFQRSTDLAGFARQRFKARRWFEDLLHRHYRSGGGIATDFAFGAIGWAGYGRGPVVYRDGRRSADLQTWIDADRLDVTEAVVDAVTAYAVALVYDRQAMSVLGDASATFAALARKFFARAEDGVANISAEIDSNGDGRNDVVIRLGLADTLEG